MMMEVLFKIIRQQQNSSAVVQTYLLEVDSGNTILDCLNRIKWEKDGTLAFRKNCRNTICGSCAMRINGRSALACKENVGSELARFSQIQSVENQSNTIQEITLAPLGNMPVIKDLVVEMSSFWNHLDAVAPYVSTAARKVPEREFLQTPLERSLLDQSGNCIMCGACYSECNAREVNSNFVGPHALAKAYRMVADSRDTQTENRLESYNEGTQGVWGCTRCFYCDSVCPMGVAPLEQITKIKQDILERKQAKDSRSIRHRKVLVDLVKQGGWIDERQFGLQVVGNYFRDLKGLLSLAPLGLRMILRGKFPLSFEPSQGTQEVRSLIESVQQKVESKN
jgi:succinate dehydrogenase / fumarate reductase iron-sulfur subunit